MSKQKQANSFVLGWLMMRDFVKKSINKTYMNNAGQTVNIIIGTIIAIGGGIFVVFGLLLGLSTLNPSSFFAGQPIPANATLALQNNFSLGLSRFSDQLPTVFLVLGVVLVLSGIAILLALVSRFRGTGGGGSSL